MSPLLIGYIAAVVDRSDRIRLVWKSRLLSCEKDAQSVLMQWEQTMLPGLFAWCTREVLPIYIDAAPGVMAAPAPGIATWLQQRRDYCLQQAKETRDGRIRSIWLRDVDTFDRALRDYTSGVGGKHG